MDFPSGANFCRKAASPEPIRRDYQATFCLNEQHSVCPVFQAYVVSQLPAMAATPKSRALETRKKLKNTLFVTGVLLYVLASVWFSGSKLASRMLSFSNQMSTAGIQLPIPVTGLTENGWQRPLTESRSTDLQPNPAAQAQVIVECSLPQGWQAYTVQPEDSLFRLSTLYGISQESLMKANCLSSYTRLTPGSTLFIPAPEPTATATATSRPYSPPALINDGGDAHSSNQPVSPTATAVPPTSVPPTPVPPVQQPVIVPNIPEPPKVDQPANPPKSEEKNDNGNKNQDNQDQGKKDDGQKEDKDKGKDDGKKDDKDSGKDNGKGNGNDNGNGNGKDDGKKDDKDKDNGNGKGKKGG